tara:strand:- start:1449 stop:1817 length:369 start_codon:yes stop_codon:yes gene_type:complete
MIKSLLITVGVSTLFAFGVADYINFWNAFAFVTGVQFITFWMLNSYQRADKDVIYSEFETNMDNVLALSQAVVECPCGNHVFEEEVFINSENTFRCPKCNNNVKLDAQITAVLLTDPSEVTG